MYSVHAWPPIKRFSLHAFSSSSLGAVSDSLLCTVGKWGRSCESAGDRTGMPSWVVAVVAGSASLLEVPACWQAAELPLLLQPTARRLEEEVAPVALLSMQEEHVQETWGKKWWYMPVNACLKECTELKFFMDKLTLELHLKKVSVHTEWDMKTPISLLINLLPAICLALEWVVGGNL